MQCDHCPRTFKTETLLREHKLCIAILTEQPHEHLELPSKKEMWMAMQTLIKRVDHLEKKFKKWEPWLRTKKRKIDIVKWLNGNQEGHAYSEFYSISKVTVSQLEYLFKYKFAKGMVHILKENYIERFLCGFRNKLYFFDKEWKEMEDAILTRIISNIQAKIAGAFIRWSKEHPEIVNNDKDDAYFKNMTEAFGGNREDGIIHKEIKKGLISHVRIELKNVTTFDFQ